MVCVPRAHILIWRNLGGYGSMFIGTGSHTGFLLRQRFRLFLEEATLRAAPIALFGNVLRVDVLVQERRKRSQFCFLLVGKVWFIHGLTAPRKRRYVRLCPVWHEAGS